MVLAQLDGSSGYITSVPEINVNFPSVLAGFPLRTENS